MADVKSISLDRFLEFMQDSDLLPIEEAYEKVGWFRRGVDIRAETARSFPFDVFQNGEIAFTEAALQWESAERLQEVDIPDALNIFPLLGQAVVDLDLHGAFYAVFESNRFNRNRAWRRLYPPSIRPQYDETTGALAGFERRLKSGALFHFAPDDLLYVWMPNPRSEIGPGRGGAYPALQSATSLHHIGKFQGAFFDHGAITPTIVTIQGYEHAPPDEQKAIKGRLQRLMAGIKHAFEIIAVGGDVQVAHLMQPLREMAMQELTQTLREGIATALGIPHSLLMSNAANFATATQDDLNFYDKTIIPLVVYIQAQLNERLFRPAGYRLHFQKSRLEVYQQLEVSKVDKVSTMYRDRAIDTAEYRALMGLPPRDEDEDTAAETANALEERVQRLEQAPDPDESGDDGLDAALRKWRRMAVKRYQEGSPHKAQVFTHAAIPAVLNDSISRTLAYIESVDGVHTVFDDAALWSVREYA